MHTGKRLKIPVVEESSHNWAKVDRMYDLNLEGRPTKVLKRLVETGTKRKWWNPKTLRGSKEFRFLVKLAWGQKFLDGLDERSKEE